MIRSDEVAAQLITRRAYRAGVALAAVASFLMVWTTIVRDDGNGIGSFTVIMAVAVGWFSAGFRPAGMARTMVGVAVMQVMVGLLIATAPITATVPGGPFQALLYCSVFAMLWLISAGSFRSAASADRQADRG